MSIESGSSGVGVHMETTVENNTQRERRDVTSIYPEKVLRISGLSELLQPSEVMQHQTGLHLINTRLWIEDLSKKYERKVTIDTIPDAEWHELFKKYDTFWFMGIYAPSEIGKQQAAMYPDSIRYAFPKLGPGEQIPKEEIVASPFAIPDYTPNPEIADGWGAWDIMVEKLHANGKKVVVDFVPNHVARDHHWVKEHLEYFINISEEDYLANSRDFKRVETNTGEVVYLAHGKDPYFDSWEDTFQLNYARPEVQEAMEKIVLMLADHSDGVRCDMAMLLEPEKFISTWGNRLSEEEKNYIRENDFWSKVIPRAKAKAKDEKKENDFIFIAEAYEKKEILGKYFDYIYAKDFYDHLVRIIADGEYPGDHLRNEVLYLLKAEPYGHVVSAENHDEDRAVQKFGKEHAKLVAMMCGLIRQAIFMMNQGQEKGFRIRPPMQVAHFPKEDAQPDVEAYYERFLPFLRSTLVQQGDLSLPTIHTEEEKNGAVHWLNGLPDEKRILAMQIQGLEKLDDSEWRQQELVVSEQKLKQIAALEHDLNETVHNTQITASTRNFFAFHVRQMEEQTCEEIGAYICMNTGHSFVGGRIHALQREDHVEDWKIYEGRAEDFLDRTREGGFYVGLLAGETQVIFYNKKKADVQKEQMVYQAA